LFGWLVVCLKNQNYYYEIIMIIVVLVVESTKNKRDIDFLLFIPQMQEIEI